LLLGQKEFVKNNVGKKGELQLLEKLYT